MPWVEALDDVASLRRCVRDLVALSTLPAIWTNYNPRQIADSVAAALVSMLDADFVYIAWPGKRDEAIIEVTHVGKKIAPASGGAIQAALRKLRPGRSEQGAIIANPVGEGQLRIATAPIGFGGDAILIAASSRPDFPSEVQRLLLGIGANETSVALQRWNAEAEERRFVSLVERSSDFVSFASLDGIPQYINPAGMRLVGLSAIEDLSRLNILDFLIPEDRVRANDECWPIVMRTGRWNGELGFRQFTTGAAMPFLVDWFRIDHSRTGRPMNIATVSRDLTEQRRSEAELRHLNETLERRVSERTAELAQANEKLIVEMAERESADDKLQEVQLELFHAVRLSTAGQMAAALAHELNQPLTAVVNSVQAARLLLAKDGQVKFPVVREILDEASQQAVRGGQIIRRLRDFVTRGEAEKRVEILSTLIEEASALAVAGAGTDDVQVRFRFDPNAADVLADRIQVQQVLINLMRNGLEAMAGARGRELEVSTTFVDPGTIEIAVADRGPGLPIEISERLFEPFVTTKRDGMGLGLVICRSIVEAHGGRLWSGPNPDGGTIFRFTLESGLAVGERHVG